MCKSIVSKDIILKDLLSLMVLRQANDLPYVQVYTKSITLSLLSERVPL